MREELFLVIDCGTQSVRAIIFDTKGSLIDKVKIEIEPYFSNYPGYAEQHADIYWEKLCEACKSLKEKQAGIWNRIIGVSITTLRDTGINIDAHGNPLRPAIIWLDQRMAKCSKSLPLKDNMMFSAIGMNRAVEITRKKSKANWIKENQPKLWKKTCKYMLLSGYLTFKLTGCMVDSIANQIGHIPFDYKNKCWPEHESNYRYSVFGVEREKLPELVSPGTTIGKISMEVSNLTGINEGTAVIASGSDKGCETLGVGCVDTSSASLSFGTTATVQTTSHKYFEPLKFLPAYPSLIPDCYNPEVEIFRGYWMISWFKKEFGTREMLEASEKNIPPEVLLNERLNEVPPGSYGLILQPFWGPGLKMPEAKGAIIGFGDVHTRAHIYRAIIEGINYALLDGVEKIEKKSSTHVERIMVSGGGSQSDGICQITADMFNRPVYRGQTYETSGLGAAINGFVGAGIYNSYQEAVKNMVHYCHIFEPDKANSEIYRKLYERVYKRIYPKLSSLYTEIQQILNYPEF